MVAYYSFLTARELISKISRYGASFQTLRQSRAESRGKMPTNMPSKILISLSKMLRGSVPGFQNIYRLNRRPYLSLLDLKEIEMYEVCKSSNQRS